MAEKFDDSEALKEWWKKAVSSYRDKMNILDNEEKQYLINRGKDYSNPIQLDIIWLRDPEFQLIASTHSKDVEDKAVTIYGPLDSGKFTQIVENFLSNSKWDKLLDYDSREKWKRLNVTNMRELFSLNFSLMANSVKNSVFVDVNKPAFSIGTPIADTTYVWLLKGNIMKLQPYKYISDLISETKKLFSVWRVQQVQDNLNQNSEPSAPVVVKKKLSCFFFPPVLIEKIPKATNFKEYFTRDYRTKGMEEVVFKTKLNEIGIYITRDGEITIETGDRKLAKKVFNLIFALAAYNGFDVQAIQEDEILEEQLDAKNKYISRSFGISFSQRYSLPSLRYPGNNLRLYPKRRLLKKEILERIVKDANKIFEQDLLSSMLIFWLESRTHLAHNELPQAYIMAWVVIEKTMWNLWNDFLDGLTIDEKLSIKLRNAKSMTIDRQINYLSISNVISIDEYKILDKLRKGRNDFIHHGKPVLRSEAVKCIELAESYIKNSIEGTSQ